MADDFQLTVSKPTFDRVLYPLCAKFKSPSNGVFNIVLRILEKFEVKSHLQSDGGPDMEFYFVMKGETATFSISNAEADILRGILEAGKKALPMAFARRIPAMENQLKPEE